MNTNFQIQVYFNLFSYLFIPDSCMRIVWVCEYAACINVHKCFYVYFSIYINLWICIHKSTYIYIYLYMDICIHLFTCVHINIYTWIFIWYVCVRILIFINAYLNIYMTMKLYLYIYIYMYMYINIYMYRHACIWIYVLTHICQYVFTSIYINVRNQ
jgi:hypothetical protein